QQWPPHARQVIGLHDTFLGADARRGRVQEK
ncbi:hypothetical protein PR002_g33141, partial [Phytophthora rubi]